MMQNGELSYETVNKKRLIDASEIVRVFGDSFHPETVRNTGNIPEGNTSEHSETSHKSVPPPDENTLIHEMFREQREEIRHLRQQIVEQREHYEKRLDDKEKHFAERMTSQQEHYQRLLTYQPVKPLEKPTEDEKGEPDTSPAEAPLPPANRWLNLIAALGFTLVAGILLWFGWERHITPTLPTPQRHITPPLSEPPAKSRRTPPPAPTFTPIPSHRNFP